MKSAAATPDMKADSSVETGAAKGSLVIVKTFGTQPLRRLRFLIIFEIIG